MKMPEDRIFQLRLSKNAFTMFTEAFALKLTGNGILHYLWSADILISLLMLFTND